MATSPGEKSFNIDIPEELYERLEEFIDTHNRPKKKQVGTAIIKLFLRLPEDVQVRLVNDIDNKEDFVSVLNSLIDARISAVMPSVQQVVDETAGTDDEEVAAMFEGIAKMLEQNKNGARILGPQASAGLAKMREALGKPQSTLNSENESNVERA